MNPQSSTHSGKDRFFHWCHEPVLQLDPEPCERPELSARVLKIRADLLIDLQEALSKRRLKQSEAAKVLGVTQLSCERPDERADRVVQHRHHGEHARPTRRQGEGHGEGLSATGKGRVIALRRFSK